MKGRYREFGNREDETDRKKIQMYAVPLYYLYLIVNNLLHNVPAIFAAFFS